MKRLIAAWGAIAIALVFATIAAAQATGRLNGEILDKEGKPFADLVIEIKNPDTGQTFSLKTDKSGKFVQLGLRSGVYSITIISVKDNLNYPVKFQVNDGQENEFKLSFKQLMEETNASHPEEVKKKEEEASKFKNMKLHFDNGVAAMTNADNLAKQIKTAPADQKSALQQSKVSECMTAITEFTEAEQGVGPKEINNHATVWANLGAAYDCASKYDESIAAYQKAVELKPQANYYTGLSTSLAKAATAQKDPKVA
ncbi:MAG: carboxypeptidase regulatory-like domain-containing protein, partial [Candidatus Acidiferrales bacterium]